MAIGHWAAMSMWEKKHTASDSITNNRIGLQGVWGWKVGYGRDPPGPELEVAGIKPPPRQREIM